MTVKSKLEQGAEEYREKIRLGLVKPMDPMEKAKQNPKSLRAAINAMCFECCGYSKPEVKFCTAKDCPLFNLRPWQPKES